MKIENTLTPEENSILDNFNNTSVPVPDMLTHQLFEQKADQNPSSIAIICDNEIITYKDLEDRSNKVANYLLSRNIKPNGVIGISIERSVDMVVAVLGVLKTGCCYLPMDPSFPADRLEYMFEDSGATFLITESSLIKRYSGISKSSMIIDEKKTQIESLPAIRPQINISNQSLNYIIYTSGSTGKPKGVKVHHQAVVNFLGSMAKTPGLKSSDCLLAVTTLSFDISVLELFLPLAQGAKIILAKSHEVTNAEIIAGLIEKHNVTILQATPATWAMLIHSDWKGKHNLTALCGGEAISPGLARDLLGKVASLWNMYGPTETTVWSTCYLIKDHTPPILVGKPIDNTTIFIVNEQNSLQAVGSHGEVCIGGLGVTKGYHNREDLTAEKFIPGPDQKTMYRTGDRGRILADGNIELVGRMDNQIKLRGFRIEPGEIESLLCQMPEIKEAVVKVQKFSDFDERLIAFLNVSENYQLTNEHIVGELSSRIPAYMIPAAFKISTSFPRTPNGKIDKKQLVYELGEDTNTRKITDPATATEEKLYTIWTDFLKTKHISTDDNFFNIGGHSLLAIPMVSKIEKTFHTQINLRSFFDHPTIKDLAVLIDGENDISGKKDHSDESKKEGNDNLMYINPQGHQIPFTLVHGDQSNYFLSSHLGKERPFYGFFHLGSDGKKIRQSSVENFADYYIQQLKFVVPGDPFLLCGYSFGGVVAFEMACKLQASGFKVPVLILIDSYCPLDKPAYQPTVAALEQSQTSLQKIFKYIAHNYFRVYFKSRKLIWNGFFIMDWNLPAKMRTKYINDKYVELCKKYKPAAKFDGEILLFNASDDNFKTSDYLNWEAYATKVNYETLIGNHDTILTNKESIHLLQKKIKELIEDKTTAKPHE